jgi:cyanate permease
MTTPSEHEKLSPSLVLLTMLLSWAAIAAGKTSLIALIVGIAALDLGVQGAQITSQSVIYSLDPAAPSRLTTAYMTAVFASAAASSALASAIYDSGGWDAVATLGAALAAIGVIVWVAEQLLIRRRGEPAPSVSAG